MVPSHQNFSATGKEAARDLAPLIPWSPAPLLVGHEVTHMCGHLCQATSTQDLAGVVRLVDPENVIWGDAKASPPLTGLGAEVLASPVCREKGFT